MAKPQSIHAPAGGAFPGPGLAGQSALALLPSHALGSLRVGSQPGRACAVSLIRWGQGAPAGSGGIPVASDESDPSCAVRGVLSSQLTGAAPQGACCSAELGAPHSASKKCHARLAPANGAFQGGRAPPSSHTDTVPRGYAKGCGTSPGSQALPERVPKSSACTGGALAGSLRELGGLAPCPQSVVVHSAHGARAQDVRLAVAPDLPDDALPFLQPLRPL